MNTDDLVFYQTFKDKREYLKRIQAFYYSTKQTITPAQGAKFEAIRAGLLADLRSVYPAAPDHENTPIYLLDAIGAVLYNLQHEEQELNDRVVANGATARQQLAHWK